jgi:hypothetical protein
MKRSVQAWIDEPLATSIDDLRRQRTPIGSEADLVRELLGLGIEVYIARQQRQQKKEKAAAAEGG